MLLFQCVSRPFLFYGLKRRRWLSVLVSVLCSVSVTALPSFNRLWVRARADIITPPHSEVRTETWLTSKDRGLTIARHRISVVSAARLILPRNYVRSKILQGCTALAPTTHLSSTPPDTLASDQKKKKGTAFTAARIQGEKPGVETAGQLLFFVHFF